MRAALQRFSRWLLVGLVMLVALDAALAGEPPSMAAPYRSTLALVAHSQWGLDAPIAVLAAQVHQESGWRADAVSRVGARSLAQLLRRENYIRGQSVIEAKLDGLTSKIEAAQPRGLFPDLSRPPPWISDLRPE